MSEEQIYQETPPSKPNRPAQIFLALSPPFLYIAIQAVVSFIGGIILIIPTIFKAVNLENPTYEDIFSLIMGDLTGVVLPLAAVSGIVAIVLFIFLYRKDLKKREPPTAISSVGVGVWPVAFAVSICLNFLVELAVSFLPDDFGGYNEVVKNLTSGSLLWQLVTVCLIAPVVEELCLRGLCQNRLIKIFGVWPSIILQAAVFGLIHLNLVQSTYAFALGIFLGWIYYRTNNLLVPILCHFTINTLSVVLNALITSAGENFDIPVLAMLVPAVLILVLLLAVLDRMTRAKVRGPYSPQAGIDPWS